MIRLTLPKVRFTRIAFTSAGLLVTEDTPAIGMRDREYTFRSWDLGNRIPDSNESTGEARRTDYLFYPNGETFLRKQGLWSDADARPPSILDKIPCSYRPMVHCWPLGLHPDGATAVFWESDAHLSGNDRCYLRRGEDVLKTLRWASGGKYHVGTFSPAGNHLALTGTLEVRVRSLSSARRTFKLSVPEFVKHKLLWKDKEKWKYGIWAAPVFLDENTLAVAPGSKLIVWRFTSGEIVHRFPVFGGTIHALAVSPDGRRFMAGSHDGTVRVWDAATFDEVARYDWQVGKVNALAFAPDGLTAAVAGDGGVVVWDVE